MMSSKKCSILLAMVLLLALGTVGCDETTQAASAQAHQGPSKQQTDTAKPKENQNMVLVRVFNEEGKLTAPVEMPKVELTREQWKERLTPAQFKILRASGTEAAFCGGLLDNKVPGVYACAGCGLPLFQANTKFHSGTGWPSFFEPIAKENVQEVVDVSFGMTRTEILCPRCGGHLGHVFNDGPKPTGLRFCTNSDALRFVPEDQLKTLAEQVPAATTQPDVQVSK